MAYSLLIISQIQYWSHQNPTVVKVDNGLKLSRNITGLTQDTFYFFEVSYLVGGVDEEGMGEGFVR